MIDFQEQFLIEFLLCALISFAVIELDGRIKLYFFPLIIQRFMNLDLVDFGNHQVIKLIFGLLWEPSGYQIDIWFTLVTIRLSNRYCKFTSIGVFGDTELGMLCLFLKLGFHYFPFVNTFVLCDQCFYYH